MSDCCEHCGRSRNRVTDLERDAEQVRKLFHELDEILDGLVRRIGSLEARKRG